MIRFTNTLGHKLEEFKPLHYGEVRMYNCGPTVWNYPHIGNYRTFLFEDLLRRTLEYRGFKITQVMNLTDVDDRIIKICKENNYDLSEFTETYVKAFFEDLDFLGVKRAEYYPRATENIVEMVTIIEGLMKKGIAYRSEDGSIYYSIAKFPPYGRLSGIKKDELKVGARVRQDDYGKDSAEDFALWKAWDEQDGKIYWDTSLGRGRPGWHIECSAMAMKYLGEEFDIHTGGVDNIFPHHENEIAQTEGFTGKKFVNYWLHSEHLLINETKMAKRLGNFITVREIQDRGVEGNVLRFLLLSGHYRAQLNFTDKSLEQAASSVKRINEFVARLKEKLASGVRNDGAMELESITLVEDTRKKYVDALENDLETPLALAAVFEFITQGNKFLDLGASSSNAIRMMYDFMISDFDGIFGVIDKTDELVLSEQQLEWLKERIAARGSKDWLKSDELRKKLLESGVEVQDTSEGQKWRRVKTQS
ncbi:MAG: cysteine--tRNA ligase [Thaumarchaeota archaeon]|nr:cysteine--tRNA ligase [Nitrososphaerota archaeon]